MGWALGEVVCWSYVEDYIEDEEAYGPDAWKAGVKEWEDKQEERDAVADEEKKIIEELGLKERYRTVNYNGSTWWTLYRERDFETVERNFGLVFATAEKPLRVYRYNRFLDHLVAVHYDVKHEDMLSIFNDLVKAKPDLHWPYLVRGKFYIKYSWYFRGTGYSNTVSQKSWDGLHKYLGLVQLNLEKVHEMSPKDAEASVAMIELAALYLDDDDVRKYYDRAISINPLNYEARMDYLWYL